MTPNRKHISVLLAEVLMCLNIHPSGRYLDCTLGAGGHALAIANKLHDGKLLGLDRDLEACRKVQHANIQVEHANFASYPLEAEHYCGAILDLGASTEQLTHPSRGFSFLGTGPLDMRMDRSTNSYTAADLLKDYSVEDLAFIFKHYSNEVHPYALARIIKKHVLRLKTTSDLANLITQYYGWHKKGRHPATKVFQALRIEVNRELDAITEGLPSVWSAIRPGGRLAVISFHRTEDALVKYFMKTQVDQAPYGGFVPQYRARWIISSCSPTPEEIKRNRSARGARLRCIEKL